MNTKIETEEQTALDTTNGLVSTGIFGESDTESMEDRERRINDYRIRYDYHEYVPCRCCTQSIEFRKFLRDGTAVNVGFYCYTCEGAVAENGTCVMARARKDGRRRVVYDSENAPVGFEKGLAPVLMKRYYSKRERTLMAAKAAQYRGGSSGYIRPDGIREAKGSGLIPKGLGN
jgi:hypothetical protein